MKYKIGELEVEAFQWNGEDTFCKISDFLEAINFGLYGIERDGEDNITIQNREFEEVAFLKVGEYLVSSKTSLFTLSEQDFNKIATKVKEPKFKVGDKVYRTWPQVLVTNKVVAITRLGWYKLDSDSLHEESVLLTLEEAIEKLKEL